MSPDVGPLYRVTVRAETLAYYMDETIDPSHYDPTEVARFENERHRVVIMEVPPPAPGHTPDEVLAAYRWAAGVIARVTLRVQGQVQSHAVKIGHGCTGRRGRYERECGDHYEDFVFWPENGIREGCPPHLDLMVPTPELDRWVRYIQQVTAEMIATDQLPARAFNPQPQEHAGPMLTTTTADTTATEEERTP